MTTINTIEELIKVLDENPQWVEALRVRLLTRELIELPEKFAQFADATNQRFDAMDQRLNRMDERFDAIDRNFKVVFQRLDRLEADVKGIRDDLGPLKGAHARNTAVREAGLIAEQMGLEIIRTLDVEDLRILSRGQDISDILPNELASFRRADLVMEAADQEGESCYVAVEVSFTINGRDTERTVRNIGFLTRFTGRPAYAAVAGLRLDDRIRFRISSGEIFWYEMDAAALEAE